MSDIQTPPEGTEQEIETPQTQDTETPETPIEPQEPETPTAQPAQPEPQPPVDYKDKFVHSQREAILANERANVARSQLESLTKQDTPTDEAMRKLYPEWDQLDDYNKKVVMRQEATNMRQARIEAQQQELSDRLKLEDEIEQIIDNPKFTKLKGKEADFKRFAMRPANRGLSAEVIAKAFLFDAEDETPPAPSPKTEALPAGSGGPRDSLKPKKVSLEEAAQIRKTDYKRYMELVKNKQIEEIE